MSELSTEAGVPCHECTHAHVFFCCNFQCTIVNHEECLWVIIHCYLLNTAQNNYNAEVKQSISISVQKIMPDHGKKKRRKRLRMWFSSRIRTVVQIVTSADVILQACVCARGVVLYGYSGTGKKCAFLSLYLVLSFVCITTVCSFLKAVATKEVICTWGVLTAVEDNCCKVSFKVYLSGICRFSESKHMQMFLLGMSQCRHTMKSRFTLFFFFFIR